ncbi:unnamed protein product [Blepharisma stoltei]|uniref:Anaphase-promoting complex subunit 11 n=1 Tax=Blepharisma stoltei TaxID=1481888 RepID=A0AAU9JE43_9CILI|nr:unnamed protein product [Blepharisma stoltei]
MKVKIEKWLGVARWAWDVPDPQCVICLLPFESPCPTCKNPGDDCAPIESECSHHFHLHCISHWTSEGNEKCPCCRAVFRIKVISSEQQFRSARA